MFVPQSVLGTAILIAGLGGAAAQGTGDPPRSTTDTVEYCDHLLMRFGAEAPSRTRHPRAAILANEGHRMCHQGHTRPGILRLRRALILLDEPEDQGQ